jgi:hypothetical protein
MKRAKQRKFSKAASRRPKPRYRLADLLAQMPEGRIEWSPELRAWEQMAPVGREFGAAEGLFEVPDCIDGQNAQIERLFRGPEENHSSKSSCDGCEPNDP